MKRSEALKLIREKLYGQHTGDAFEELILNAVEEIGMQPPTRNLTLLGHDYTENEWEPEDGM